MLLCCALGHFVALVSLFFFLLFPLFVLTPLSEILFATDDAFGFYNYFRLYLNLLSIIPEEGLLSTVQP